MTAQSQIPNSTDTMISMRATLPETSSHGKD